MANAIQPVKVTLQSQRAGDTAKHNDRTMYEGGYFNDLAPDDGIPNYHWTKEKFGIDSDEMEHLMYESLYMDKKVKAMCTGDSARASSRARSARSVKRCNRPASG